MTLCSFSLVVSLLFSSLNGQGDQPNPPTWPDGVYVFDPSDPTSAQDAINAAFTNNGGDGCHGQFSSYRYAFLFKQGTHSVSVPVGYYTSVAGLGMSPTDVTINEVYVSDCSSDYTTGALINFWRSAENFQMTPITTYNNLAEPTMLWAVSQATPLRRVVVNGGLSLYQYTGGCCAGYASGGFIADIKVSTNIYSGSQQQFLSRNVNIGSSWQNGVWNMVFVGCNGAVPSNSNGDCHPYTSVSSTPVVAEKPFIYLDESSGKYSIIVPQVETNKVGPATNWGSGYDTIDFSNVYVATHSTSEDTINSMLSDGYSILFGPGIYNFTKSIEIGNDNTVVLGIGWPTFSCGEGSGSPCFVVADGVTGVRLAGLLLQASNIKYSTTSLLQMGSSSSVYRYSSDAKKFRKIKNKNLPKNAYFDINTNNPNRKIKLDYMDSTTYNFVSDVYARVGGTNDPSDYQVSATYMIDINMDNVIVDGTWLWRADHDVSGSVYNSNNPVKTGFEVNGDNVIVYGLAVEHTLGNLVEWNGNNGQTYFYQSEFPYDVTQENYGDMGYVSYNVTSGVTSHAAYGVGAYSYFRDNAVTVNSGFAAPSSGTTFTDPLTIFLNGNGEISHVVNNDGEAVNSGNGQSYLCSYP